MGRWIALIVVATAMLAAPAPSPASVSVGISVSFGPPALPYYDQPPCPAPGYIWTPGYWAWNPGFGYFWVPGTWVMAPFPGALWTPGYWAFSDGLYLWNEGYWGPVVGFYGGIYYGFGYTGHGYDGGYWRGDQFYYNRAVNNVRTTNITNVYEKTVVVNNENVTRASYNGGPSGAQAQPTAEERAAATRRFSGPVASQEQHVQAAQGQTKLRASENKGRPAVAATAKPADFSSREVVQASRAGAPYVPPDPKAIRQTRSEQRSAPAQIQPSDNKPERGGSAPNVDQPPKERPQPAPHAGKPPKPEKQPHQPNPPSNHGGGNGHKPDKPKD